MSVWTRGPDSCFRLCNLAGPCNVLEVKTSEKGKEGWSGGVNGGRRQRGEVDFCDDHVRLDLT